MFPVTITLHSFDQLNAVTNALGAIPAPAAAQQTKPDATAAGKAADKVVAKTEETAKKLQGEAKPEAGGDAEKTYTVEDAKKLTTDMVKAGKRDAAVKLLAEFGVDKAAKLEGDKIAEFCVKAESVIAS
jgi:hypothetical protein